MKQNDGPHLPDDDPSLACRSRRQRRLGVIVNSLVGGVFGVAFGSFGHRGAWLLGGLAVGALFGLINEALFARAHWLARWYRLRLVLLVLGEVFLVFYLVMPAYGVYHSTHPTRVPVVGSPADLGLAYEDVELPTADGLTLRGWYVPSRNGAAVIGLHGSDGNRTQLLPYAQVLAEGGYGVLLLDLRTQGESDGSLFPVTDDSLDVAAAVTYLRGRPDVDLGRIGALGLSLGAHVILQAAPGNPGLKALVVDGASNNRIEDLLPLPPGYRLFYLAAPMWWMSDRFAAWLTGRPARPFVDLVPGIAPRPILFIASSEEPEPFANRRLAALAGPAAQLWEPPDTGHVGGLFQHPDEYKQRLLSFFDATLLGPGPVAPSP